MGGLKTLFAILIVTLALPGAPAEAGSRRLDDLTETFADCTGRLSAMMEHQWIIDPPASDRTRALRAMMIDLLDTVTLPDTARAILNRRVEAKMAQAKLLFRARNLAHPRAAAQAERIARRELRFCEGLLLS